MTDPVAATSLPSRFPGGDGSLSSDTVAVPRKVLEDLCIAAATYYVHACAAYLDTPDVHEARAALDAADVLLGHDARTHANVLAREVARLRVLGGQRR